MTHCLIERLVEAYRKPESLRIAGPHIVIHEIVAAAVKGTGIRGGHEHSEDTDREVGVVDFDRHPTAKVAEQTLSHRVHLTQNDVVRSFKQVPGQVLLCHTITGCGFS